MDIPYAGPGVDAVKAMRQTIVNARPIPDRRLQRQDRTPMPVTVRLVWERDGEELRDTRAVDWVGRDVLVEVIDQRYGPHGVWVDAGDVRRR